MFCCTCTALHKTLFPAFSEMDEDNDGQITQKEFIEVNFLPLYFVKKGVRNVEFYLKTYSQFCKCKV